MLQYIQGFNPNNYTDSKADSGNWSDYLGPIGDLAGGIYGIINNERSWNHQKEVDAFNMDMAQKNYEMAMNQMNWQQEAQKTAWAREDNAIQRRVADLQAAGLSKWLAAGQAAQSGGVTASNVSSASNLINSGANLRDTNYLKGSMDSFLLGSQRKSDISLTETQQDLTQANIDNVKQDTINKSAGLNKTLAETDYIYGLTENLIKDFNLKRQQFLEQKKLWESEKNKNSAQSMELRQSAENLQAQGQLLLKQIDAYDRIINMDLAKGEESIKNSKSERRNRTAGTVFTGLKLLSSELRQWLSIPF